MFSIRRLNYDECVNALSFLYNIHPQKLFREAHNVCALNYTTTRDLGLNTTLDSCLAIIKGDIVLPTSLNYIPEVGYFFTVPFNQTFYPAYKKFFTHIPEEDRFELFSGVRGFPIAVNEHKPFKQYVHPSFRSKFFGAKSEKVKWDYIYINDAFFDRINQTASRLWFLHCNYILDKVKDDKELYNKNLDICLSTWELQDFFDYLVYATDEETGTIICVMQVGMFGDCAVCGHIALTHNEKYKPYSLVSSAHYAALDFMFNNEGATEIDFGFNGDSLGDYKSLFATDYYPVYGLRTLTDEELNTIKELYK